MDLEKLDAVDGLAGRILSGDVSFETARIELNDIILSPPYYSSVHIITAHAVCASMAAIMFFGGSLWDAAVSLVLGAIGGLVYILTTTRRYRHLQRIYAFVTAFICSLCARLVHLHLLTGQRTCFFAMALGPVYWLLPGIAITTGVTELASNSIVSGSSRMFASLTIALQLGFGLSIGSRIVVWDAEPDNTMCSSELPLWLHMLSFLAIVTSIVVLLNLRPVASNLIGVYLAAAGGLYMSKVLDSANLWTNDMRSFISALVVGAIGGVHSRLRRRQNLSSVVCGVVLLVPGAIGLLGARAFLADDVMSGLTLGFKMFTVSLSISVGQLIAKVLIFPVSSWDEPQRNQYQPTLL